LQRFLIQSDNPVLLDMGAEKVEAKTTEKQSISAELHDFPTPSYSPTGPAEISLIVNTHPLRKRPT
jgi:hypothetical protein